MLHGEVGLQLCMSLSHSCLPSQFLSYPAKRTRRKKRRKVAPRSGGFIVLPLSTKIRLVMGEKWLSAGRDWEIAHPVECTTLSCARIWIGVPGTMQEERFLSGRKVLWCLFFSFLVTYTLFWGGKTNSLLDVIDSCRCEAPGKTLA